MVFDPPQKNIHVLDMFPALRMRAQQAERHVQGAEQEAGTQLPLFPESDDTSAIPNYLARTPLFAPIRPGRRTVHDNALLPSPHGVELRVSGPQLDMADQDVFLLALRLAQGKNLNEPVLCGRSEFLKALGWTASSHRSAYGKSAYDWLDQSFQRLTRATLHIKTKRFKAHLSLVSEWVQEETTGKWEFTVGSKIVALFENREYAFIDLGKRRQIGRRIDLAKWLQCYAATHRRGLHRASVADLRKWCGYSSPVRKFREALADALGELEKVNVLVGVRFYKDKTMVQWARLESAIATA